jgi:hypothetical protein
MTQTSSERRFGAYILMTIGGLMTVLCGGCTAVFLFPSLWAWLTLYLDHGAMTDADRYSAAFGPVVAIVSLIVGGLPTAVGVLLFVLGRRRHRVLSMRTNEGSSHG